MINTIKEKFRATLYFLWSIFLKGLLTILPLALTLAIINFSFKFLKSWLRPIYDLEPDYLKAIPFSEFLLTFFVVVAIGVFLNIFVLRSLVTAFETLIGKIPLVRPIYVGIKQLVQAFNPHDHQSFKHVVLIEFPRPGIYSIGFMTSEVNTEISPDSSNQYYNVFVPTTPNPTTGFFFMVAKECIRIINISRQEAMALIISGGIIQPERFNQEKK